jgi:hypothetical protein
MDASGLDLGTIVEQEESTGLTTAADLIEGSPVAQLEVGPEPARGEGDAATEGRTQIDFASWRDQHMNNNQVRVLYWTLRSECVPVSIQVQLCTCLHDNGDF